MRMKKLVLIMYLISVTSFCLAQEVEKSGHRTAFGFLPQYTIIGGLRFDIDRSVSKTSNQWIIFSPQVFAVTGARLNHDFKEMWGVGMDVKHRVFLKASGMEPSGFYVQYGGMFQYFSMTDNRQYTESYTENGVQYFGVFQGDVSTNVYKFGGNFHLGYQWLLGDKVYFDIYTGAGIRISHNNRNSGFDTWYNNAWVDYGYSGTLLDGGFRVGFYF